VNHVLATQRLVLRPVEAADHAALLAHWTAPDVREFLFDGEVLSPSAISGVIEESTRDFASAGYGLWLVFEGPIDSQNGAARLIGTTGLRPLEDLGLEVLYSLTAAARGKGYATEAAGAVLGYALGTLGLPQVFAEVDEGNRASQAVLTRLGMTPFDVVPGVLGPMTRYRRAR